MSINFAMWQSGITSLVKISSKAEWDRLDVISQWLIATRSGVTTVTIYIGLIAGLLAWRDGFFSPAAWIIITLGLFFAHGAHNLINDLIDYRRGVDVAPYFRTQYGAHPLAQGFWTERQQWNWIIASGVPAFLSGIFALFYSGFSPTVIGLFAFGAVMMMIYTWPIKSLALGELSIFLIWGPIMAAGVYLVMSQGSTVNIWQVALAAVPFGLSVVSINIGKHIDKASEDKAKGIGTLPVVIGEAAAQYLNIAVFVLMYAAIVYLVFVLRYFTPVMLIVFFAGLRAIISIKVLTAPRPTEPPKDWPAWPAWFSGFAFYHNRLFSNLLILGLVAEVILRAVAPSFWTIH